MTASDTRRAVRLTMLLFFAQPFAIGCWMALIPVVKGALGLNEAQLAIALMGLPVGIVPTLPVAGRAISRFGPRRVCMAALPVQALVLWLVLLAGSQTALFLALMLFGAVGAFSQVGLNTYAGRLEKERSVGVMSRCHGLWAIGVTAASAMTAMATGLPLLWIPLVVAIPGMLAGVFAAFALPKLGADSVRSGPGSRRLSDLPRALILISLFALVVAMTEGAMSDWSAVYMAQRMGGESAVAGLAVSVYAAALAIGRLLGDTMRARVGPVSLARGTILVAILGVVLVVAPLPNLASWLGFALVGLGVSVGYPLGVTAVAALDDRFEGPNIAIMSMIALCGFLIGPPLIGFLAEAYSLRIGLAALLPLLAVSLWLAGFLKPDSARLADSGSGREAESKEF
ncbi:MFS transporter [Tropicimonas sp. TH_r6]|uniref:MFS transporter n=1 Tax=Tropicimonas sp. TH_r6 TaxID=3082085 RepID=UPI002952F8F0|nr:MFS transporter [Tropicimonas sp. TH_r6]MDV7143145.1 MFS transporter [Tropicimonas sp. TH_r6]